MGRGLRCYLLVPRWSPRYHPAALLCDITLRPCYALSGTDIAYGRVSPYAPLCDTDMYGSAMRCP
eukprot:2940538-Rhodomonas_salina.1